MRLDAAPSYAVRASSVKANAAAGVGAVDAAAAVSGVEDAAVSGGAATPPPSIDGKGTLINTYA